MNDMPRIPVQIPVQRTLRYALQSLHDPLGATRDIYAAYGPFAIVRLGIPFLRNVRFDRPILVTVGVVFNREVMANPTTWRMVTIFRGAPKNSAARRLSAGLARMTGRRHAHYRRAFDQPLRKVNVNKLGDEMVRLAAEEVADWPVGEVIDLKQVSYRLIRTFAVELIFGGDRERGLPIANGISQLLQRGWSPKVIACPIDLPTTSYGQMLRGGEALERCILDWADSKRGRPEDTDLLSIIVNGRDEEGNAASDATIVGHVTQLFSAAFETCQNVLVSTLMLLAQHPAIARDLLDELRGKLAGAAPTLDNIGNLPLLEAVIKETLRILPPVPLSMRVATQDTTLAGYAVPRCGRVVLNPFLTNRLPDLYPDADSFQPKRWATTQPTAFEFLAFGAGPRACPGFGFAMNVLKVALATVMMRYRVSLAPRSRIDYWVRPLLAPCTDVPAVLNVQDAAFKAVPIDGNIRGLVRFPQ